MRNILILGDIHGNFGPINFKIKTNPDLHRDSIIIQVGDFGVGFKHNKKEESISLRKLNRTCKNFNIDFYAIRGNHDDPAYFQDSFDLGLSNIRLIPDYSVLTLEGKNFLFVGGAVSIDRVHRIEGEDYWRDEKFILDITKIEELKKNHEKFDYVITHTAPNFVFPFTKSIADDDLKLKMELLEERNLVAKLYDAVKNHGVKKWFYGHFHNSGVEYFDDVVFNLLNIDEFKML